MHVPEARQVHGFDGDAAVDHILLRRDRQHNLLLRRQVYKDDPPPARTVCLYLLRGHSAEQSGSRAADDPAACNVHGSPSFPKNKSPVSALLDKDGAYTL